MPWRTIAQPVLIDRTKISIPGENGGQAYVLKPASPATLRWLKTLLFILCLLPAANLAYGILTASITGDPVETMTEVTGQWALRFLMLTLSITPLRKILKITDLIKFRRMLGLFAFFYAVCHLNVYIVFDQYFDWPEIWRDTVEKKFVFAGMLALVLMIPLAITSTNGWIRRLGGKRWQRLHRLVYLIAIAAVIHYIWLVKADLTQPLIYALILLVLLGFRLVQKIQKN